MTQKKGSVEVLGFKIQTEDWRLQEEMERQRTEAKRMLDGLTMVEDKVQDKQEDKGRRPSRFLSTNFYFKKRAISLPVYFPNHVTNQTFPLEGKQKVK
jgi:hypothetical protein